MVYFHLLLKLLFLYLHFYLHLGLVLEVFIGIYANQATENPTIWLRFRFMQVMIPYYPIFRCFDDLG